MIRFSAQGAYLLLVPQGMELIRYRALISFFKKQPNVENKSYISISKGTTTETNGNSYKYTENVQLTRETQTKTTVFVMWHHPSFVRY